MITVLHHLKPGLEAKSRKAPLSTALSQEIDIFHPYWGIITTRTSHAQIKREFQIGLSILLRASVLSVTRSSFLVALDSSG
jgi:hypothetical protein